MGSGKSNILQRYHKNVFTRISPTIGSEFLTKKIVLPPLPGDSSMSEPTVIKAQIWDTSGSERYRSITTGHYRSAVGAVLVMDITERESFDNLDYWLGQLRQNASEQCQICLMANKCDRASERQVSEQEVREYAERQDLMFLGECSALNNTLIKEHFEKLIREVH